MAAVAMVALLLLAGLAIDLGMVYASRAESQRASDAAALAGASAFLEYESTDPRAISTAKQRAKEYAVQNYVRGNYIDTTTQATYVDQHPVYGQVHVDYGPQVIVSVMPDLRKVQVRSGRLDLPSWFARLAGIKAFGVRTLAEAEVTEGGSVQKCVLPFALVDLWDDLDDDTDRDGIPDADESWLFENDRELAAGQEPDRYYTYDRAGVPGAPYGDAFNGTGYGSNFRNGVSDQSGFSHAADYGRQIVLKGTPGEGGPSTGGSGGGGWSPNHSGTIAPGSFQIWAMPDPEQGCHGSDQGASAVWWNIENCNPCKSSLGVEYNARPGDVASISRSMERLYNQDPDARWVDDPAHPHGGYIANSRFSDPYSQSPLVRIAPIIPPTLQLSGNAYPVSFVQFAKVFLEPGAPNGTIYARFLGSAQGTDAPVEGSLVKQLRLVK